ncbi:MAG: lamin tail domain-containing protein [bacterium]|nr:lamin tail domain-containing protein [bacterium]
MANRLLKWMIAGLMAASALLTAACSLVQTSATEGGSTRGGLIINEVVSSNRHSLIDPAAGSPDWIELYNASDSAINLAGYGLSDNVRKLYKYTFPDVTIEAGEYLIVYAAENNGVTKTDVPCTGFGLSKNGDSLYLCDGFFEIVQEITVPALLTDASYARRDNGTYGYCASPTPGAANTTEILDSLDSLYAETGDGALYITEVQPDGNGEPWAEIYNASADDVRLDNYYLSDADTNLLRSQLPEATLKAGEYAVIYLTGKTGADRIETSFKLGSADANLYLSNWRGVLVSQLGWAENVPAGLTVVADADGVARYTAFPTPGEANSDRVFASVTMTGMDADDPVRISEVLRNNKYSVIDADGDRTEWVELYNGSDASVSLSGYYLSDNADNLFKWAFPAVDLEPGAYLVVFLSGKDRTEGELHASFGLSKDEPGVYLTRLDGLRLDSLEAPPELPDNVSVGREPDGSVRYYAQPTPGYQNAYGFETAEDIGFFNTSGVYISEVCAVNAVKSEKNDWIELYNGSDAPVDLTGWYLSDDDAEPLKYRIDGVTVAAGAYAVIETSSHPTRQKEGVATFGISPAGDTIVLSDANGLRVDTFETGVLSSDITSGRIEGNGQVRRVFFTSATRGKANSGSVLGGYAPEPVLSETALYHTEPFELEMAADGAEIRYTTDGSKPTQRSKLYTDPITITKNTVIRAASFQEDRLPSDIATYTYLFEEPHTLPVVCVNGDPDLIAEVFRATKRTDKVEREAFIQWYETDGSLGVEFPCGIKGKGAGTLGYQQKSLAIHLRAGYGRSDVTYPFFADSDLTTFVSLVLRNSGQDLGDHVFDARVRDAFAARAVAGMNIDYALNRPVIMYLNGRYYGIYDFGEDQNKDYLVNHYGVDGDAVDIIQRNTRVLQGGNADIKRVFAYAMDKNLADDELFAQFAEWIDVDYFTDYFIAQTYFYNSDMFNQKYWRSQDYAVKWRPIFYDLDFCFNASSSPSRNIIPAYFSRTGVPSNDGSLTHMNIYVGLEKNAGWRQMCAERYVQLICTQFQPERLLGILDELVEEMRPEMARHIAHWGHPKSMSAWEDALEKLRSAIRNRPQYALENVQSYFHISSTQMDEWIAKYSA